MYPPVDPILIEIGPLAIRWYGLIMMAGIFLAALIASREVARRGLNPESVWDMLLWVLIPGFLGARLYYVFIQAPRDRLPEYLANPLRIFAVWEGGIHIFGGLIAGALALYLYARRSRLPLLPYLDAIALGLPLAQAVVRWANFINQELYGPPTSLPWGLRIDAEHRIAPYNDLRQYPEETRFHPLFLYESLWNLIGFGVLFWISRRYHARLRDGDLTLLYLVWYPTGRFFIEFLRTDSWRIPGTPLVIAHVLAAAVAITAATMFILRRRRDPLATPPVVEEAAP